MRDFDLISTYNYFEKLLEHLHFDNKKIFSGELVLPRQLEIHLPGNLIVPCNFNCSFCEGRFLIKTLDSYEEKAIKLIKDLSGRIPFIILGGIYSEPLLNPFALEIIKETKKRGSFFGIHTNGSLLKKLEESKGFIKKICELSSSTEDYISISLDAGTPQTHRIVKGTVNSYFNEIIEGIRIISEARKENYPTIRVTYLVNDDNSSEEDIESIVKIAKNLKIDSLRFSIPYEAFGKDFSDLKKYKEEFEDAKSCFYEKRIKPHLSKSKDERPYIFYMPPIYQAIDKMKFNQCIMGYYQITIGTDGYVYRCSSTASQSFSFNRLGKIPDNFDDFKEMIRKNQDKDFNPKKCFNAGARCDRVGLMINYSWSVKKGDK
ncbi:MAG: hypothetical protein PWR30_333 [Candidatus Woesearchaeota archaeon]|nr:hypothetical protein [Candidatus Woesearchaeota archaeon]